jgi:DNA-binding CsgD family transcriptional regulator
MKDIVSLSDKNQPECRRFIWSDIISEVNRRKAMGQRADVFSDKENKLPPVKIKKGPLKKYGLGAKYNGVWFTRREAECMVWLLKDSTIDEVAMKLKLSLCTIINHIEHMREKTGCSTTSELIALVQASEFLKSIDFQH